MVLQMESQLSVPGYGNRYPVETILMADPYESPKGEQERRLRENRLRDLCLWPVFAAISTVILSPPDIYSLVYWAAISPISFLAGATLASSLGLARRIVLAVALFILTILLLVALCEASLPMCLRAGVHFTGNAIVGAITFINLLDRRRAIVASMAATYFLGALIGPGGGMLFSILGAIVIDRLPVKSLDNNGMNGESPKLTNLQ